MVLIGLPVLLLSCPLRTCAPGLPQKPSTDPKVLRDGKRRARDEGTKQPSVGQEQCHTRPSVVVTRDITAEAVCICFRMRDLRVSYLSCKFEGAFFSH